MNNNCSQGNSLILNNTAENMEKDPRQPSSEEDEDEAAAVERGKAFEESWQELKNDKQAYARGDLAAVGLGDLVALNFVDDKVDDAEQEDADNIVIAYPDEGAWKRFHGFFKGMEEVVCTKVRQGDKRLVKLKEGEPAGRHVIIVDDLVQSGGTLIECQKLLSRLGAVKVSAYVTHGVFPGNSWKKFCAGGGGQGFYKFFLTDSCPGTAEAVRGTEPFEILSLARPIAEALHV